MSFLSKLVPRLRPLPEGLSPLNPHVLVATWFGTGLIKPAPGTMGTIAAVPPGLLIMENFGAWGLLGAASILMVIGTISAGHFGKKTGETDDQRIVVDEVVGLWIAALPAGENPMLWATAFVTFRFFDIFKVWPASFFDKRKSGGFDVMMDDVVAGIFAFICVASQALPIIR